jgi:hypothetical protein
VAPDDDARLIGVSASAIDVIASPSTRAALNAIPGDGLSAQVLATATKDAIEDKGDYTSLYCNGSMKFNNSTDVAYYYSVTEGSKKWYPTDQDWVYLSGLYPAGWDVDEIDSYGRVESGSLLDGKTDLMYAKNVKSTMFSSSNQPLEFKHLLTQLKFKLTTTLDETKVVRVKTIKLTKTGAYEHKLYANCCVALNTGAVIFEDWGPTELLGYLNDDTEWNGLQIDVRDNPGEIRGYVLAPSLSAAQVSSLTAVDYTLSVKYEIDDTSADKKQDLERTAKIQLLDTGSSPYTADTHGKSFIVTLNFNQEITAKATIAEWTDGGKASADVE